MAVIGLADKDENQLAQMDLRFFVLDQKIKSIPLKEGGSAIKVNKDNLKEYQQLMA